MEKLYLTMRAFTNYVLLNFSRGTILAHGRAAECITDSHEDPDNCLTPFEHGPNMGGATQPKAIWWWKCISYDDADFVSRDHLELAPDWSA